MFEKSTRYLLYIRRKNLATEFREIKVLDKWHSLDRSSPNHVNKNIKET
jgi:hypothetical protein